MVISSVITPVIRGTVESIFGVGGLRVPPNAILTEEYTPLLTENNEFILLED